MEGVIRWGREGGGSDKVGGGKVEGVIRWGREGGGSDKVGEGRWRE